MLARAHDLATELASRPLPLLRYTRAVLTMQLPVRLLHEGLSHGLALEGCGTIPAYVGVASGAKESLGDAGVLEEKRDLRDLVARIEA